MHARLDVREVRACHRIAMSAVGRDSGFLCLALDIALGLARSWDCSLSLLLSLLRSLLICPAAVRALVWYGLSMMVRQFGV